MPEFNAAHVINEARERNEQLAEGEKLVPILAAVIAVFAALATLFANHSSITGLATKNEAILVQSKAVDQWNYYQAKQIKLEVNNALILSGAVTNKNGLSLMNAAVAKERKKAADASAEAQQLTKQADDEYESAERYMRSYEKFEVSATLFEVSIVLVSITALMRAKTLLWVAGGATIVGAAFFLQGWLLH
jgi:hypothetical protein